LKEYKFMPGMGEAYIISCGLVEPCREVFDRMYSLLIEMKPDVKSRGLSDDTTIENLYAKATAEVKFDGTLTDLKIYCKAIERSNGISDFFNRKILDTQEYEANPVVGRKVHSLSHYL
jgi:hypothetical protein